MAPIASHLDASTADALAVAVVASLHGAAFETQNLMSARWGGEGGGYQVILTLPAGILQKRCLELFQGQC